MVAYCEVLACPSQVLWCGPQVNVFVVGWSLPFDGGKNELEPRPRSGGRLSN